ncbi:hypothetical protein B0H34DRAFT_407252 [Crassisporium funariophilum]|nr:hypothetical protein B0H34DRAFT_407252 [Crassisporium funariophilum]
MAFPDNPNPRAAHRRSASSPLYPTRNSNTSRPSKSMSSVDSEHPQRQRAVSSRFMMSVKRSLTPSSAPKKRGPEYTKSGMQSTYEEASAAPPPQLFRDPDPASSRPTLEQIAMGLHVSRTPHIRPLVASPYAFSQRHSATHSANPYEHYHHHHHRASPTPVVLPPPPSRSSMKKPSTTITSSSSSPAFSPPFSNGSGSSITATSQALPSARVPRTFAGIKSRMTRFLPSSRSTSLPASMMSSNVSSPRTSSSEFSPHPKKAVRFTTEEDVDRH